MSGQVKYVNYKIKKALRKSTSWLIYIQKSFTDQSNMNKSAAGG